MTGDELKQIREMLGMKQKDFGALFGYHQAQIRISEFERGVRPIPKRIEAGCAYIKEKSKKAPIKDFREIPAHVTSSHS